LPEKSHVKPPSPITPVNTTTSVWHFSFTQVDILDIEIRKAPAFVGAVVSLQEEMGRNPNGWNILDVTPMDAIF
jgi:hypothetical protein